MIKKQNEVLAVLPALHIIRWTARRKADIIKAIDEGVITPQAVAAIHGITSEELEAWRRIYIQAGVKGLRATRLQRYRRARRTKRT